MRRHHVVLLALAGLMFCQPRAATAHPHKELVPTLVAPTVTTAPTLDGKYEPAWWGSPQVIVDAMAGETRVPLALTACATADAWFLFCQWYDPTADRARGGAGANAAPASDGLVVSWANDVLADGTLQQDPARKGETTAFNAADDPKQEGATCGARFTDSGWYVEFRRPLSPTASSAKVVRAKAAFTVTVSDPKGGGAVTGPIRFRVGGAAVQRDFEDEVDGEAPVGVRSALAGKGKPPSWVVRKRARPGASAGWLVQEAQDEENDRYPLALVEGVTAKDVNVRVLFQALKGFKDRAAGVVWRAKDEKNQYILRANMLEGNVVLYKMQDGLRIDLPPVGHESDYGVNVKFDPDAEHFLHVTVVGDRFQAYFDARLLFDVVDTTFPGAGGVGLWTKSDSVIAFDNVWVVPLDLPKGG